MSKHRGFQRMRIGKDQEDTRLAIQITLGVKPNGYTIGVGLELGVRQMLTDPDGGERIRENIKAALAKVLDACAAGAFDNVGGTDD